MTIPNLTTLPYNVARMILLLLQHDCPTTLLCIRMVSRQLRDLVDEIIYRSITLSRVPEVVDWERTKRLCQRFLDPKDILSCVVQEITIDKWENVEDNDMDTESPPLDNLALEQILRSVDNLLSFNWNNSSPIPENVLSAFQNQWPDAHLGVINRNRSEGYVPIDMDLLESPQLYLLDIEVISSIGYYSNASEFPLIRKILLRSKNLKKLRLGCHNDDLPSDFWGHIDLNGPLNLQFEPGDICPSLQELKLPKQYRLDLEHCIIWRSCMDWSSLKTLDLGDRCPENLFTALVGYVPNLKFLRLLLRQGNDPEMQCSNMSVVG